MKQFFRRLHPSKAVLLVFAMAASAMSSLSAAGRDWDQSPAIVICKAPGDLYALGDVHGDYDRLKTLLEAAEIIESNPGAPNEMKWAAGNAILVCTGDLIDKGVNGLKVIAAFRALQNDAAKKGGRVIVTMGNHEAEFLADPTHNHKEDREFLAELQRHGIDPQAVADGRDPSGIGAFLRSLPFAARVDDWFFAHAGNTKGMALADLDTALKGAVDQNGYGAKMLSVDDSLLEAKLKERLWWEMPNDTDGKAEERLHDYIRALGARHLVIGHQHEKVKFTNGKHRNSGDLDEGYGGLIFLIDVGMSRAVNASEGSLLRIHGHPRHATIIDLKGKTSRLWTEKRLGQ